MLRELYIEATYYRIPELQVALTEQNFLAKMFRIIGRRRTSDHRANAYLALVYHDDFCFWGYCRDSAGL